mmetsp:Transcript_1757/g.2531  ORF Transcript_1757/g.2531 Transcript_1757/m.2531 type:complete len:148 (+) Transcript_1757:39-482(+)
METSYPDHRHPCDDFTQKVIRCHRQYGKQGEECVREELDQKKCYAQLLCRNEAVMMYDKKSVPLVNTGTNTGMIRSMFDRVSKDYSSDSEIQPQSRVSCATLVEAFAKPENHLLIPEGIKKEDRDHCRKVVHNLAACLSKKRRGATS